MAFDDGDVCVCLLCNASVYVPNRVTHGAFMVVCVCILLMCMCLYDGDTCAHTQVTFLGTGALRVSRRIHLVFIFAFGL